MNRRVRYLCAIIPGVLLLNAGSAKTSQRPWPKDIKRCSINEPDLEACLLQAVQQALPKVSKGVPSIGLKSLDPLNAGNFSATTDRGLFHATFSAINFVVEGASKIHILNVKYDRNNATILIKGVHDKLHMEGRYACNGTLVGIPLSTSGSLWVDFQEVTATHKLKLGNNNRDKTHGRVTFRIWKWKSSKINVKDAHLNKHANNAFNRLLSANFDPTMVEAMKPRMERIMDDICTGALRPLTSKFTASEFFPSADLSGSERQRRDTLDDTT